MFRRIRFPARLDHPMHPSNAALGIDNARRPVAIATVYAAAPPVFCWYNFRQNIGNSPMLRPRRSLLFVPGSNPRAMEKARALPADGLIFDLEDAVAPAGKEGARTTVAAAIAAGGYGARELVLRVNSLDTPWGHADLAAAATMPIDAVLLPKVENADRVRLAVSLLDTLGAPSERVVWCMLETPLGILNAREIAAASPRLTALVAGTSDL